MLQLRRVLGALGRSRSDGEAYQEKLASSLEQRCRQLETAIPAGSNSVLDIGCNLGDITAWCARRGYWTVGLDSSASLVRKAQVRHPAGMTGNCAFMHQVVNPGDVGKLPMFDVILLLSVHHHWLMAHGPEVAGEMLRDLAGRARLALIFEGASRNVRYGNYPPGFIDNDEASVTGYLGNYLRQYVGNQFSRIEPLGKTSCVGEREPYRWAWALIK